MGYHVLHNLNDVQYKMWWLLHPKQATPSPAPCRFGIGTSLYLCHPMEPIKLQYLCTHPIRNKLRIPLEKLCASQFNCSICAFNQSEIKYPGFPYGITLLFIPNIKPCAGSRWSTRGVSDIFGNGPITLCPPKVKSLILPGSISWLGQFSRVGFILRLASMLDWCFP